MPNNSGALPGAAISQAHQNRIDGGPSSERQQEKHLRGFILRGEACKADIEAYKLRFGDPHVNDKNEKLLQARHAANTQR